MSCLGFRVQAGPAVAHPCDCFHHHSPQVERAMSATVQAVSARLPGSRHRYPWAGGRLTAFAWSGADQSN